MSSSEKVSHLMLRNKLQVGMYAYPLTNVPFECIGLPSSEFFYISSGDVSLSKWEDAEGMCPNERCVNSDKLEGFIQNRWKLISCHWRPVELTIKGTRMILLQTDILFQQHDRTC